MKKILRTALILTLVLALCGTSALACTGFYVGKDASADGTYIIGHTVDAWNLGQGSVLSVPGVYNEPGRVFTVAEGVEFPLPDTTYAYTTTPFTVQDEYLGQIYDGTTANEMGVSCTGAVTTYTTDEIAELDPLVENGLAEAFLCRLVAMCASTAREGVEVLGKYVEMFGNAENNTIFITDQNEAWYVEYYTGHQWCAVRMPDDCVAVFGNESMLGAVDVNSEDVICSEGLVSMPEEAGLAVFTDDGLIDLFATYSGVDSLADYSNRRTWYGHVLLAPSTAGEYETSKRYDLFYQPDELVTLKDVFELTRARFEGTEFCPEENPEVDGMRVIGIERQLNTAIAVTYPDLPADMSVVSWVCNANAEHSVYLPVSNLVTDTAASYKYLPDEEFVQDEALAHYCFKRLSALAEQERHLYGEGVRAYWSQVEDGLLAEYPGVMALTLKLYDEDPAAAAEYVTNYTIGIQNKAVDDANLMFSELMEYMINKTNTQLEYDSIDPFVPSILTVDEVEEAPVEEAPAEAPASAEPSAEILPAA